MNKPLLYTKILFRHFSSVHIIASKVSTSQNFLTRLLLCILSPLLSTFKMDTDILFVVLAYCSHRCLHMRTASEIFIKTSVPSGLYWDNLLNFRRCNLIFDDKQKLQIQYLRFFFCSSSHIAWQRIKCLFTA